MEGYIILLSAVAVLLAVCVALLFRNRAQAERHKRELTDTINRALQANDERRQQLDGDLLTLGEKHRAETIAEQAHWADRADFDNDWSSLPKSDPGYIASIDD